MERSNTGKKGSLCQADQSDQAVRTKISEVRLSAKEGNMQVFPGGRKDPVSKMRTVS